MNAAARLHGMHGQLFVVCGPSGAGKTSLVRECAARDDDVTVSISHTTRQPRDGERVGADYFFIDEAIFSDMVARQAFLECAEVFGSRYGTAKAEVERTLLSGTDVILEIDWQGARQVRAWWPAAVGIFILPPSLEVLTQPHTDRRQDSEAVIADRMDKAVSEVSHHHEFDYLIVNESFEAALQQLRAVLMAARLGHGRQAARYRALLRAFNGE